MNIVFSDQYLPRTITKSIFLAGPSPRTIDQYDWRHDAVEILTKIGFDGTVFVPTPKGKFAGENDAPEWNYDNQIEWECKARQISDIILFWVPRDIAGGMAGMTTNVEFGEDLSSGKIMYGRPDHADKVRYLDQRAVEAKLTVYNDLFQIITDARTALSEGALRINGEVSVPLFIWNTEQFQSWYQSHKILGNSLEDAKVLHHTKFSNGNIFCFTLWAKMWVASEERFKSSEFVFARKDVSCILPYYTVQDQTYIVLVKEFRTPVRNSTGYVHELAGGSSVENGIDPLINAQHELHEECGIYIEDISRFEFVASKQLAATLCSHQAHLYAIELSPDEMLSVNESIANDRHFGLASDGEVTYVEVINVKDIMKADLDFSMIGMILGYINGKN